MLIKLLLTQFFRWITVERCIFDIYVLFDRYLEISFFEIKLLRWLPYYEGTVLSIKHKLSTLLIKSILTYIDDNFFVQTNRIIESV